jgi:hypothetical protein
LFNQFILRDIMASVAAFNSATSGTIYLPKEIEFRS